MAGTMLIVVLAIYLTMSLGNGSSQTNSLLNPSTGVQSQALESMDGQSIVTSVTAAQTYYASNRDSFDSLTATTLAELEPSVQYTDGSVPSQLPQTSSAAPPDIALTAQDQTVGFAAAVDGGSCLYALDIANSVGAGKLGAGTWWAVGPARGGLCSAPASAQNASPTSIAWSQTMP
jgi:hypothetical protein